jgi:hypothetical protein
MRKSAFGVSNGLAASRLVNGGLAWLARKGLAAPNGLAASPLGNGLALRGSQLSGATEPVHPCTRESVLIAARLPRKG